MVFEHGQHLADLIGFLLRRYISIRNGFWGKILQAPIEEYVEKLMLNTVGKKRRGNRGKKGLKR